ncbi:MAG: DUF4282 domain-containing protein [Candidatus Binataceae bacterium]
MALVDCTNCGHKVSTLAPACPSCGAPPSASPAPNSSSAGIREPTTLLRDEKGLLATVFDLSFKHFVTLRIVRWLFVLGIVAITIAAVISMITGFDPKYSAGHPAVIIALTPIVWLGLVIALRVALETMVVLFRIAENTGDMAARGQRS